MAKSKPETQNHGAPLPTSGPISISDCASEFGEALDIVPLTAFYNADFGVPKSTDTPNPGRSEPEISLSDMRGKIKVFVYVWNPASSPQTWNGTTHQHFATANFPVLTAAGQAGWNGFSDLIFTIKEDYLIHSTTTASPALRISTSYNSGGQYGPRWPRTITIDNQGWIMGRGGNGSGGNSGGTNGGDAIRVEGVSGAIDETDNGNSGGTGTVFIDNYGAILGGGGGGSGGATSEPGGGGGGAGGGNGGNKISSGGAGAVTGFTAGSDGGEFGGGFRGRGGQAGGGGGGRQARDKATNYRGGGGGGGKIPPGPTGAGATGGSGGTGGGGNGGADFSNGGNGGNSGGGGGYGRRGGNASSGSGGESYGGFGVRIVSGPCTVRNLGIGFRYGRELT